VHGSAAEEFEVRNVLAVMETAEKMEGERRQIIEFE